MFLRVIFITMFLLLATVAIAFAHGGEHGTPEKLTAPPIEKVPAFQGSIYAIEGGDEKNPPPASDTGLMGSPLSRTNPLGDGDPLGNIGSKDFGEPMVRFKGKEHTKQSGQHEQHKESKQHKPHVEKATHEWISPSSRGYGVAVGITILSGLGFGILSIIRIGEGTFGKN
jgi:hypothetical protein